MALLSAWGYAQGPDSLYKNYKRSLTYESPMERDSQSVAAYGAYALYQVNAQHQSVEQYLDTLEQLAMGSKWGKAPGIYWHIKGRWYDIQGNLDNALQFFNLSVDSLRNAGPPYWELSTAMVGAGFVLLNTGLHEEALVTFREASGYAKSSGHTINEWKVLNFLGDYYYYSAFRQENYDSALYYYLRTDTLVKENGLWGYFKADNDLGLADVYRRLGKEKLSDIHFEKALTEAKKYQRYGIIYALYIDQAEVFEERGQLKKALDLKLEAYKYVLETGNINFVARADQQLYYTYKSLGDTQNALVHYEKYIAAQDSMNKNAAKERYAELEAKYQSEQKQKEIGRLRNANLEQGRNFWIAIALIGLLLIAYIGWNNRNLRIKNVELAQKNQEILLAQLRGQNLERRRMATELHDNLNTKIAAIRWQLEAVSPAVSDKAQNILTKTLELVNDVYGDVRLISHNLMPEKVEALGLIPALENLLTQLKQNNKVQFHLVVNTPPDFDFASLTYHLYNIIFEMINNILKHAQAQNGWISISAEEDTILLTVSDDGVGFEIDQMTNGYGIRNITSRLENINGKWKIESAPGKGTKFFIEIPKIG